MEDRKKFDENLYLEFDSIAKKNAIPILKKLYPDCTFIVNPDKFKRDILAYKDGKLVFKVEVEVKQGWETSHFSFKDVHFPQRRKESADGNTKFLMFNKILTDCLIVESKDLLSSPLVYKPNRFKEHEYFFSVSKDKCKFMKVPGGLDSRIDKSMLF